MQTHKKLKLWHQTFAHNPFAVNHVKLRNTPGL